MSTNLCAFINMSNLLMVAERGKAGQSGEFIKRSVIYDYQNVKNRGGGVIHSFMREREREERHEREQASRDILLISVHVGRSFSFLIFFCVDC
jgi:hypothetical protein